MAIKNVEASVLTRLKNQSKEEGIPFLIDIGIDDVIVPNPIKRSIVTRLPGFTSPEVYTYSLESTIAEKFDAILQRMAGTSSMKDFYDIYYLSGIFDFEGKILIEAVKSTCSSFPDDEKFIVRNAVKSRACEG